MGGLIKPNEMSVGSRLEAVRISVEEAAEGLSRSDYLEFMDALASDMDGWRMELDESRQGLDGEG